MSDIKLIERLYSQSYISYIATYVAALLALWIFIDISPKRILLIWFVIFSIVTFIRFIITWSHNKKNNQKNAEFWLILFLIMSAISGTLWGLTSFVFIPADSLEQLDSVLYHGILLLIIAALIAGSIVTYSACKSVYLSFSVPAIVPPCLMLIAKGDKYHSFLGGVVLAYAMIMFVISVYIHRVFSEYADVEFENEKLKKILDKHNISTE